MELKERKFVEENYEEKENSEKEQNAKYCKLLEIKARAEVS